MSVIKFRKRANVVKATDFFNSSDSINHSLRRVRDLQKSNIFETISANTDNSRHVSSRARARVVCTCCIKPVNTKTHPNALQKHSRNIR